MDPISVQLIGFRKDLGKITEKMSKFKKDGDLRKANEITALTQKLIHNVTEAIKTKPMNSSKLSKFKHVMEKAQAYSNRVGKEEDPFAQFEGLDVFIEDHDEISSESDIESDEGDIFAQFEGKDLFESKPLEGQESLDSKMELHTPKALAERAVSDFVKEFGINGLDVDKFNSSAYMEGLKGGPESAVMAVLNNVAETAVSKALKAGDKDGGYNAALNACKKLLY